MSARDFFSKDLPAKMKADEAGAKSLGGSIKFAVAGAGTWVADFPNLTVSESDGEAKCTVEVSEADFNAILAKTLNPQMAFMSGKLKIKGDMGLAMKLGKVLG